MKSDKLDIRPPRREQREELFDLVAKVFSHHGYFDFRDFCRRAYINRTRYDWDASRVGWMDGRMVTHWGVWDYRMRVGRDAVRVGGIGAVSTHGDYRKRGLMGATAIAGVEAMGEQGYDMSILFGIHGYYDRYGYVRAWNETSYHVDVANMPGERPDRPVRRFSPKYREDLDALYDRQYAGMTGTAIRPVFELNQHPDTWLGYMWSNERGGPAGYVIVQTGKDCINCLEAVGDVEQVLRALGQIARRRHVSDVAFWELPFAHPVAKRLRRTNCRVERTYVRSGKAMIRTIDLHSTLEHITGELSRRLKASDLSGWRGELRIVDPRETVSLKIDRGRVRVAAPSGRAKHAIRGGEEIAQLIIGTDEPGETVEAGGIRLTGEAAKLVDVLFPAQHPTLCRWDHY